MKIDVLTLFPDMFPGVFGHSIFKKAQEQGYVTVNLMDFREFSKDKHKKVDDYPYGGGEGMVLSPQPIFDAVASIRSGEPENKPHIVLLSPQGVLFSQKKAQELTDREHLLFICGRYEGYDERIREHLADEEISIGDYVMTGGELAAMVIIDSVVRLLPGVLGNEKSYQNDSFSNGLLEFPQYTRPADFQGLKVPDILLSGHHRNIEDWRHYESFKRTFSRRPDLLGCRMLSEKEKQWINQWRDEE